MVTEAVRLNNAALRGGPHTKRAGKSHWSGDGGHPAWYFGSRVVGGKEAPEISPPCKERWGAIEISIRIFWLGYKSQETICTTNHS